LLLLTGGAAANPDFTLLDLDGKTHRLSDYRGKWVVVNYWATWCPPCLEEIPELVDFHDRHKDLDAVVLGVNMEQVTLDKLRQFVEEYFISYPVLPGTPSMATVGPVRGLPTTYLVAPDGRVVARQVGGITAAGIETFINNSK
jgi:peroxiredoxin